MTGAPIEKGPWARDDERALATPVKPVRQYRTGHNPAGSFFGLIDPSKWEGKEVPARRWVVEGLIPDGDATLFSGHGGHGKSWISLQLAICAATGRDFLGLPTKHCPVFYFSAEDGEEELHHRTHAITKALSIPMSELTDLAIAARADQDNLFMTFDRFTEVGEVAPTYGQVMNQALVMGAGIVILDSRHNLFTGNENSRPIAYQFMKALRIMARETQAAVIMLDHPSKDGRKTGEGDGGSTAWHNAARARLYLTASETDRDVRGLSCKKLNYGRGIGDLVLKWRDGIFTRIDEARSPANAVDRLQQDGLVLDGLRQLQQRDARVALNPDAKNSLASLVRRLSETRHLTHQQVVESQSRLLGAGKLVRVEIGPPSRRYAFLRTADHRYPGETGPLL